MPTEKENHPSREEINEAKINMGYNLCLDCIDEGWYDPSANKCSYDGEHDCRHNREVTWNPEIERDPNG